MSGLLPRQIIGSALLALTLAASALWLGAGRPLPALVRGNGQVLVAPLPSPPSTPPVLLAARRALRQAADAGRLPASVRSQGRQIRISRYGRAGILCARAACALIRLGEQGIAVAAGAGARGRLVRLERGERVGR